MRPRSSQIKVTRDTPKFDKVLIHSNWSSLRGTYWAKFQQTKTYWFVDHIFLGNFGRHFSNATSTRSTQHSRACAARDRKIVPHHRDSPNNRNGAHSRSPSPFMTPDSAVNKKFTLTPSKFFVENKTPTILSGDARRARSELSYFTPVNHFLETWSHKMFRISHFYNLIWYSFSWIFNAISSEKSCLISMSFTSTYIDVRTVNVFLACWIHIGQFKFLSRQLYTKRLGITWIMVAMLCDVVVGRTRPRSMPLALLAMK